MSTFNVQHFGHRLVIRTTDSAGASFGRHGRYFGQPTGTPTVDEPPAAATADSPRANAMTPAEMNKRNREHYRR